MEHIERAGVHSGDSMACVSSTNLVSKVRNHRRLYETPSNWPQLSWDDEHPVCYQERKSLCY